MKIFYLFLLIGAVSCSNKQGEESQNNNSPRLYENRVGDAGEEDEYSDGTWCADVEYYNPNTGTHNSYNLDVEIEGGELVQINWPNGGFSAVVGVRLALCVRRTNNYNGLQIIGN